MWEEDGLTVLRMKGSGDTLKFGDWYNSELITAKQLGINLNDFEFIKYIPGLCERGVANKFGGSYKDGYELYIKKK